MIITLHPITRVNTQPKTAVMTLFMGCDVIIKFRITPHLECLVIGFVSQNQVPNRDQSAPSRCWYPCYHDLHGILAGYASPACSFEFSASVELDKYNGMRAKEIIQIICSKTKSQHFYSTCKSQFAVLYKWLTLDEQQIGSRYFQKVRGGPEKVFSWLKQRHHQKGGWPSCTAALAGHRHSPTTHLPVWIQLAANIICVTL